MNRFVIHAFPVIVIISSLLAFPVPVSGQSGTPKKAVKAFEIGMNHFRLMEYSQATAFFEKAVSIDSSYYDALIMLGETYEKTGRDPEAIPVYEKAIAISPGKFHGLFYLLAGLQFDNGLYADALRNFSLYLEKENVFEEYLEIALQRINNCRFAINAIDNPVPFNPVNLGEAVNSEANEYFPCITADNNTLLFTRLLEDSRAFSGRQEDFFISIKKDGAWQKAVNLGPPINTLHNEGAPALSADGQVLVFTACESLNGYGPGRDGFGRCDLFMSVKQGDSWSSPVNIGEPVNSRHWESQPSLASDGRTLYFVSNRNNNYDIWYAELLDNGLWEAPKKLSNVINTPGHEGSVFIHPDNKTLYFSSDGHTGMGGMDIFFSRRGENGEWQEPVNLGYPINTHKDENSILVSADGTLAFFASDRDGGFGGLDIYMFPLYEEAMPNKVTYMKGVVYDAKTAARLEADFDLIDLITGEVVVRSVSDRVTGEFLVCLPVGSNYALNVSCDGYLFYSDHFVLDREMSQIDPYIKDVPLSRIVTGEKVVLRNIFFETDEYNLQEQSKAELDRLVRFLDDNPSVSIEIGGHTDATGGHEYNVTLSENRAMAVYNYLADQGIDVVRLSYKGFGDAQPVDTNETEEGKAANRRTEFRIINR